jgi:hypothetical protein
MYDPPLLLVFLAQGPALRFLLIFGLVLLLAPVLDPLMEFPLGPFEVVIPIRTLARYGPEFGLMCIGVVIVIWTAGRWAAPRA